MEIKTQGLYYYVSKEGVRVSPFFYTEDQAILWWVENDQ